MEVYAGFVEHADTQAGRLLDELDRLGIADNTLVFYIWSDNGSSAEGQNGTISELLAQNGIATKIEDHIKALDVLGGLDVLGSPKTDNMYHAGWAWAGSTPHQGTKLLASYFGGTRTPMAVKWPKSIKPDRTPRPQFHHVNDIVPTIYDVLGITAPRLVDRVGFRSANSLGGGLRSETRFVVAGHGQVGTLDLREDYSQAKDLAKLQPQKLAVMTKAFDAAAQANKVYPIGGGL